MSHTRSRVIQYLGLFVVFGGIAISYWYFSVRAGGRLNAPQTGTLTSGLVGYWTFDGADISGTTATDKSTTGANGTLTNGPAKVAGKVGQALSFWPDGVDTQAYVHIGDPAGGQLDFGSGDFSVGFWMKTSGYVDQSSSVNVPLSKTAVGTGNAAGYYFQYGSSNQLQFVVRNGSSTYALATPTSIVGDWHYYMGVRSGSTMYFYQDGVSVGSTAVSGSTSNSEFFQVGSYGAGGPYFNVNGSMDEVRVYNRALAATEIQSLYDLGSSDKINSSISQKQGGGTLANGLAGYWKLDDNTGTSATDSSTNGNTGTLTSGPTWTTGQIGYGVNFDGTDDYVQVADNASLQIASGKPITISAWVYPAQVAAYGTILVKGRDASDAVANYALRQDATGRKLDFYYSASGVWHVWETSADVFPTANQWYFVTVTYTFGTGTSIKVYINGVATGGVWGSGGGNGTVDGTSQVLTMGLKKNATAERFSGKLDEVRLYHRILSPDEVSQLYRLTTPTAVDTSLKGYWSFDGADISGTTAFDRSGAGNSGTFSAAAVPGKVGQALNFFPNGSDTNARVVIGDPASGVLDFGSGDFSVSIFARARGYVAQSSSLNLLLEKKDTDTWTSAGYGFAIDVSSNIFFQVGDGSANNTLYTLGSVTDNIWHHYVGIRSGSTLYLYVDGRLVATGSVSGSTSNTQGLYIGSDNGGGNGNDRNANADIDEVRIYNRALTASEIQSLYDSGQSDKINSAASTPQGVGRLDSSLAGYWALDDGSGTNANDASTNNNDGTLTNGPTWGTGQIGSAVTFDGSDDYITAPHSTALNFNYNENFSVALWVKIPSTQNNTTTGSNVLVQKWLNTGPYPYVVRILNQTYGTVGDRGKIYGARWDNTNNPLVMSSMALNDNIWHHISFTKRGSILEFYVDGVLNSTATDTTSGTTTNGYGFYAGSEAGTQYYLTGSLDDIRVYNRALSSDEVSQLYRIGTPTGTDTSLKGYWSFNGQDVSGTTAYDRSGGGFNGTITGATVTPGKLGQGLSFNGSSNYVTISDQTALKPNVVTLSAWIKPSSLASVGSIIEKGDANTAGYGMYALTSSKLCSVIRTTTGSVVSGASTVATLRVGTWSHLAVTYDGTTLRLYVDGVSTAPMIDGACGLNTGTGNIVNDTSSLRIGARNGSSAFFNGMIDESRVYNRALSDSEIASLYNSGR